jgi:hypothetical protein
MLDTYDSLRGCTGNPVTSAYQWLSVGNDRQSDVAGAAVVGGAVVGAAVVGGTVVVVAVVVGASVVDGRVADARAVLGSSLRTSEQPIAGVSTSAAAKRANRFRAMFRVITGGSLSCRTGPDPVLPTGRQKGR